mgnify:CR=1 FL=1
MTDRDGAQVSLDDIKNLGYLKEKPSTDEPQLNKAITELCDCKVRKSKIRKILNILCGDSDLSETSLSSDSYIVQLLVAHTIITGLSEKFDREVCKQYDKTLRELTSNLCENGINRWNAVAEYQDIWGQHPAKFGPSNKNDIVDTRTQEALYDAAKNDTEKLILDCYLKAGLQQAELRSQIHSRSLETLTKETPYIVVVDPETGPKERPYIGDPTRLLNSLTRVEATEVGKSGCDRLVLQKGGEPCSISQIGYTVRKLLNENNIESNPSDLTDTWRYHYISAITKVRRVLLSLKETCPLDELSGGKNGWRTYIRRVVSSEIHTAYNVDAINRQPQSLVPDELSTQLSDDLTAELELKGELDQADEQNYIRSSLLGPLEPVRDRAESKIQDLGDAANAVHRRGVKSNAVLAAVMVVSVYSTLQLIGFHMLGITPENWLVPAEYDGRVLLHILILSIYLIIGSVPLTVRHPGADRIHVNKIGFPWRPLGAVILREELLTRIKHTLSRSLGGDNE